MSRRTAKHRPPRTVRVSYEPNRLADACLADAYAEVVPVVRRPAAAAAVTAPAPTSARRATGGKRA